MNFPSIRKRWLVPNPGLLLRTTAWVFIKFFRFKNYSTSKFSVCPKFAIILNFSYKLFLKSSELNFKMKDSFNRMNKESAAQLQPLFECNTYCIHSQYMYRGTNSWKFSTCVHLPLSQLGSTTLDLTRIPPHKSLVKGCEAVDDVVEFVFRRLRKK